MSYWKNLALGDDDPAAQHQRRMFVKFVLPAFTVITLFAGIFLSGSMDSSLKFAANLIGLILIIAGFILLSRLKLWQHVRDTGPMLIFALILTAVLYAWNCVDAAI